MQLMEGEQGRNRLRQKVLRAPKDVQSRAMSSRELLPLNRAILPCRSAENSQALCPVLHHTMSGDMGGSDGSFR